MSDNYLDVMSHTLQDLEQQLKLARQLLGECKESFSCLVAFYGENAQAFANDAVFWSDVVAFVEKFTACQQQLCKLTQVPFVLYPSLLGGCTPYSLEAQVNVCHAVQKT